MKDGKYFFGMARVGAKGQIVIPKKARDVFNIKPNDEFLILGDENKGLGIVAPKYIEETLNKIMMEEKKDARD